MENQEQRIAVISARLRVITTLLMFAIPVVLALVWAFMEHLPLVNARLPAPVDASTPTISRWLGFAVSMLPGGVAIYALTRLRRLFGLYARGIIFQPANVRCYRQLGWSLFAWAGASFLFNPLASIILTFHWKPGTRLLVINLDSQDLLAVFMGLVVLTVSWVMDQGRRLSEEQALIV
jgi:Protein of unknown function (DUF2975)